MTTDKDQTPESEFAAEIDHLAEDLLDAAESIQRLTRKHSEDVQAILKTQAESIKAFARRCDSGKPPLQ